MADGPISTGLMNAFQIYGQQQGLDLTRRQIGLREQELQQDRSRMEAEARRNDFIRTMDFYKTQIDAAGNKKFATKFRQNAGDTAMGLLRDRIYPAMGLDGSKLPQSIDVSMFDQDIVDYKNKLNEVYSQWKDKKLSDSDALMQFSMINSEFPSIESRLSPGDAQKIIKGESMVGTTKTDLAMKAAQGDEVAKKAFDMLTTQDISVTASELALRAAQGDPIAKRAFDMIYENKLSPTSRLIKKQLEGGVSAEEQPPPQALKAIQDANGQEVTFANGQTWKIENGKPIRVK